VSDRSDIPRHLAIIMDGNGRWAVRRNEPRTQGHEAGGEALKRTIEAVMQHNIPRLTVFAFSSENWSRPPGEVKKLLDLFLRALTSEIKELDRHNVRVRFIGDRSAFNPVLRDGMRRAEKRTRENQRLLLNVAVNYGGRADILQAARRVAEEVREGRITTDQISESTFARHLWLSDEPAVDLLIRTGGEQRLSNFILWQLAYTELYFSDVLWPDFSAEHLSRALDEFAARERRFGGVHRVKSA